MAAVESRQIDLALGLGHLDRSTAHALGELPLCWIAGRGFSPRADQALPLVVFEAQCLFRQRAIQALEGAGLPWRIAAVSPSLAGLWGAALGGLGVTARGPLALPPGLLADPGLFELPPLGSVPVTLHMIRARRPAIVERLADLVREACTQQGLTSSGRNE